MSRDNVIVVDNGSGACKAGIAGEELPSIVISSYGQRSKGRVKRNLLPKENTGQRDAYIGGSLQNQREINATPYPIERGIITHWEGMEKIWDEIFSNGLKVNPTENTALLTEVPFNPKSNREKITQVMFETYNFRHFHVAIQALLSHYTYGRVTGIVTEVGDGVSHTVPIYEGCAITHAIVQQELAGKDVTDYLSELLKARGYFFSTPAERALVNLLKEELCYVAQDYEQELTDRSILTEKSFTLPDGQEIEVGKERFQSCELLFRPQLQGFKMYGLHENIVNSLQKCDIDTRADLYVNIILSGATPLCTGLVPRVHQEIKKLVPYKRTRIVHSSASKYSAWLGGSILGSLSTFRNIRITQQEYEEWGPCIVHKKCF